MISLAYLFADSRTLFRTAQKKLGSERSLKDLLDFSFGNKPLILLKVKRSF